MAWRPGGGSDDADVDFFGLPPCPSASSTTEPAKADSSRTALAVATADADIPVSDEPLPEEIEVKLVAMHACFTTKCILDLKVLSMRLRNAELNPRKSTWLVLRLLDPHVTAMVAAGGGVKLLSVGSAAEDPFEEVLRHGARRVARLLQRSGYPEAVCEGFRFTSCRAQTDLGFPVRLEALARKWGRHVTYQPDVINSCIFYLQEPRCTFSVKSTGKVIMTGLHSSDAAKVALQKVYPIFREFSR